MQEKFRAEGKKLYFGIVNLDIAFDRVLREVIRWAMHKLGVRSMKWRVPEQEVDLTWTEIMQKDCQARKMNRENIMDRNR